MRNFGLIGYPLTHSFSKKYFTEKFERENLIDHRYDLFEIPDIDQFPSILKDNPSLVGLNVTIPYKLLVIPFLDELDPACKAIGAVNTICIKNGHLKGYNTDYYGFKNSLISWLGEKRPNALVLGTGGASKAVIQALQDLGIRHLMVSRTTKTGSQELVTYDELASSSSLLIDYPLIINTTPLGTYPRIQDMPPIPLTNIGEGHYVYDLVYNPENTALMQTLASKGAKVKNGLEMLHLQAEAAWEIWNQ